MGLLGFSQISLAQVALTEDFEGTTFPPAGWTTIDSNPTENWFRVDETSTYPVPVAGTGSAAVNYNAADASDESLISPSFSLAGYTSAYLNFTAVLGYEYMAGAQAAGDFIVYVSGDGGTTWDQIWVEEDEGVYTDYDPLFKRLEISAYAGNSNVKVKFEYTGQDADTVVLDDISVTACPPISNLTLTALTDGSATFTWDGTASGYSIEYGDIGFEQGTGTVVNFTTTTGELTELTAGTGYSFYIRSTCGLLTNGVWEGPYNIYTTLSAPANLPYSYGFESATLPTAGWASSAAATGGRWGLYGDAEFVYEGEFFAGAIGSNAVTNAWLFSRGLNLVGDTNITLTYWLRKADLGTGVSANNSMTVSIGTDRTAAAQATTLATHNNITDDTYVQQTQTYYVPASGVYYIGFHAITGVQTNVTVGGILLDGFNVTGQTAGTDDNQLSQLSVFPNPATNVINVVNNANILVNGVQIIDLNGRTVKSVKYDGVTEAQINISDLANGMYMMTVSSDKGTKTQKIVKN
ncbi:choice-of-anchor J domain-containing protein [Flavobacterium sp. DGU11]|uniref:Choice-of-anchor J domain-containing protein n=1 Tax=Flavobacterium arundinis TaxID=3139143 RepID=A0ABU9I091_9FLAO